MKKQTWLALLLAGTVVAFPTTAHTSNTVETTRSSAAVSIENKRFSPSNSTPLLHYNGSTYVPLRAFVDQLNGSLYYDGSTEDIQIYMPESRPKRAAISAMDRHGDLLFLLHSEKDTYTEGETPSLWASLLNIGEEEVTLTHGDPMITFEIFDENGISPLAPQFMPAIRLILRSGNEVTFPMSHRMFVGMRLLSDGVDPTDPEEVYAFLEQAYSRELRPGTYTVRAHFDGSNRGSAEPRYQFQAELQIKVQPKTDAK